VQKILIDTADAPPANRIDFIKASKNFFICAPGLNKKFRTFP
jgi:hypothetical protein